MARYDDNPEATWDAIDNQRWLHTGDLAAMDDDGFVSIEGRLKELAAAVRLQPGMATSR